MFKKRNIKIIFLLSIISAAIYGCSFPVDKITDNINNFVNSLDSSENDNITITGNETEFFEKTDVSYYLYNTLNNDEQIIYSEIYDAINHYNNYAKLSCLDVEDAKKIYSYVLFDHPEIFWVDATSFEEIQSKTKYEMYFKPEYTFSSDEITDYISRIDGFYNECMSGCESNDPYYLTKYFYKYIIDNTSYNENVDYDQTIISAICSKESVCAGYAKLYQFLLQRSGIECTLVTGVANNTNHAWNLTNINGKYYYTDTTWGDMDYSGENTLKDTVNFGYLNITSEEIRKTHTFDDKISLPEYSDYSDNYYVRENLYLSQYSKNKVNNIISSQQSNGYATIKCADSDIYEEVYEYLIEDMNITRFISDKDSIDYLKNDDLYILTFEL